MQSRARRLEDRFLGTKTNTHTYPQSGSIGCVMSVLDYKRFRNINTGIAFAVLNGLATVIVYRACPTLADQRHEISGIS